MPAEKASPLDLSFFTQPRFQGPADDVLCRFADAQRRLITRLASDLRSTRTGRFGGRRAAMMATLAASEQALLAHVDAFEKLIGSDMGDPELAPLLRTVVANIANDHNTAGLADSRAEVPIADEAKFDVGVSAPAVADLELISDKLNDLSGAFGPLGVIGAIVRNVGAFGATVQQMTGGDEVGEQLERKLDFVIPLIQDLDRDHEVILGAISDVRNTVNRIERLLFGGTTERPPMPPGGQPQPPPPPPPLPPIPPEFPPILDRRVKKIYVYEEDVFNPASSADFRTIRVRTQAFDLTGFVDLTALRPGDQVTIDIAVALARRPPVGFASTTFDRPRLYAFSEFARGENKISGSDVSITIRQPLSANGYTPPIDVPYQFVVESQ